MKFIDEATITVESGHGGRGCVSFRREKYIPRGGPDGGDGGNGGDIVLVVAPNRRTLFHFRNKRIFQAPNGQPGQGRNRTGASGESLVVEVPPGTIVRDAETNEILMDLTEPEQRVVLARGGQGGQGNARFKSARNRAPRFAQPGEPGESLQLHLELKLLADIGIIGLPNAGKSTLIRALSAARPKIGNYPFTTLTPSLGVVYPAWGEPFVMADIPGLIEGAHTGQGLGIRFLKHIERTRLLVHLVDGAAIDENQPLASIQVIQRELACHSRQLAKKPQLLVFNKIDIDEAEGKAAIFEKACKGMEVLRISAASGQGVEQLRDRLHQKLMEINASESEQVDP